MKACHTPKCIWEGCNERIPTEDMDDHVKICKQRTETWNKVNHISLLSLLKISNLRYFVQARAEVGEDGIDKAPKLIIKERKLSEFNKDLVKKLRKNGHLPLKRGKPSTE